MRRPAIIAAILCLLAMAATAQGGSRFAHMPAAPEMSRAFQYASMSETLCLAELRERGVPFERVGPTRGVQTPIRFTGPLHGVRYLQTWRAEPDPKAAATILDCRLALAIDDMSLIFARHGVVEVEYLSMYRRGRAKPGVRHPSGRAIDVATATLEDGTVYSVHHHFYGRLGAQTCGKGAAKPRRKHPGARFWRSVVCELAAKRSFNLLLTPHYDWGHRDHLHLEVRSGVRWFLTH